LIGEIKVPTITAPWEPFSITGYDRFWPVFTFRNNAWMRDYSRSELQV